MRDGARVGSFVSKRWAKTILAKVLDSDETLIGIFGANGSSEWGNGVLLVTTRRVVLARKPFVNSDLSCAALRLEEIAEVEETRHIIHGAVTLHSDSDSLTFDQLDRWDVPKVARMIRRRQRKVGAPAPAEIAQMGWPDLGSPSPAPLENPVATPEHAPPPAARRDAPSLPEQFRQLAQLRDEGVLTEEEFVAAKAVLLRSAPEDVA